MQAELDALENKLTQLIELSKHLREENNHLRQELAQARSQCSQCDDKIDRVKLRLEKLLAQSSEEQI